MPHANVNSPVLLGVNSTTTGLLSGSSRLILYFGIDTAFAQVWSV